MQELRLTPDEKQAIETVTSKIEELQRQREETIWVERAKIIEIKRGAAKRQGLLAADLIDLRSSEGGAFHSEDQQHASAANGQEAFRCTPLSPDPDAPTLPASITKGCGWVIGVPTNMNSGPESEFDWQTIRHCCPICDQDVAPATLIPPSVIRD